MSRFGIGETGLSQVRVVTRQTLGDDRGWLSRLFCAEELAAAGWHKPVAQIAQTFTARAGSIRGLHYQTPPAAEMKLIACLSGAVHDVAVDLRAGSPSFLEHHAETLSAENRRALLIPEGCAHGFQTLTDKVTLLYLFSAPHTPACEGGVSPFEPRLGLTWPLPVTALSPRDKAHPPLPADFEGIVL